MISISHRSLRASRGLRRNRHIRLCQKKKPLWQPVKSHPVWSCLTCDFHTSRLICFSFNAKMCEMVSSGKGCFSLWLNSTWSNTHLLQLWHIQTNILLLHKSCRWERCCFTLQEKPSLLEALLKDLKVNLHLIVLGNNKKTHFIKVLNEKVLCQFSSWEWIWAAKNFKCKKYFKVHSF